MLRKVFWPVVYNLVLCQMSTERIFQTGSTAKLRTFALRRWRICPAKVAKSYSRCTKNAVSLLSASPLGI